MKVPWWWCGEGVAWIYRNSGSVKTAPRTPQKNQPTGSTLSASTSLAAKATSARRSTSAILNHRSTTLGPNPALADLFSKYRTQLLAQSLQGFVKRQTCFPDCYRLCRAAHLFADWTCRLHWLIAKRWATFFYPYSLVKRRLFRPCFVFPSTGRAAYSSPSSIPVLLSTPDHIYSTFYLENLLSSEDSRSLEGC